MLGGGPGAAARCAINPDSARPRAVGSKETGVALRRGDVVRFDSQGGGGYGPPAERAPAAVARDVADGKLSPEAARRLFGHAAGPGAGATAR
jgi:N-methylhydantoinase B